MIIITSASRCDGSQTTGGKALTQGLTHSRPPLSCRPPAPQGRSHTETGGQGEVGMGITTMVLATNREKLKPALVDGGI